MSDANLKLIREFPCTVCGAKAPSDPHHWITRGAGGEDALENLISLCRKHHHEVHQVGRERFLNKYGGRIARFRDFYDLPPLSRKGHANERAL